MRRLARAGDDAGNVLGLQRARSGAGLENGPDLEETDVADVVSPVGLDLLNQGREQLAAKPGLRCGRWVEQPDGLGSAH